jgi:hypothetical protein
LYGPTQTASTPLPPMTIRVCLRPKGTGDVISRPSPSRAGRGDCGHATATVSGCIAWLGGVCRKVDIAAEHVVLHIPLMGECVRGRRGAGRFGRPGSAWHRRTGTRPWRVGGRRGRPCLARGSCRRSMTRNIPLAHDRHRQAVYMCIGRSKAR